MIERVKYHGLTYSRDQDHRLQQVRYFKRQSQFKGKRISHYLHRVVWEDHNGPVPHGKIIKFIDGNKGNCSIENLRIADDPRKNIPPPTVGAPPVVSHAKSGYVYVGRPGE